MTTSNWEQLFEDEDDEPRLVQEPAKRKAGRPPGSKTTTTRESILAKRQIAQLYHRFEPFLTENQKEYIQGIVDGKQEVDCLYELQLLVRQQSLLYQEASMYHFEKRTVTKELSDFGNSLRMSIKDLTDLQRYENEQKLKQQMKNDLVRVTDGGSALEGLEALIERHSKGKSPAGH